MASRSRNFLFTLLIYLAFFCSGAGSLVAEVTWNRMLIVVVGNSLNATAMIIAVFMGGLGLGSFVGGRYFGNRKTNLLSYITLELGIGVYVVLSPALFGLLAQFFSSLADGGMAAGGLGSARILVSLLALIIPAFLMGATFPAIVAATAQETGAKRTARTGYLYSINTLGAAIGCFAAGYHLLLEFGVQFTLNVALVLYLVAAGSAMLAIVVREKQTEESSQTEKAVSSAGDDLFLRGRYLLVATFVVGFVSLAYEVLLTRMSILFLGNSVSVFPLVLTAFLLGTGISAIVGTWLYGWLSQRGMDASRLFGILALLAAIFIILTPYLLLSDKVIGPEHYARFADSTPLNPFPILGLLIVPTIMIGALLPVAIRMLNPKGNAANTRGAATLYTLNTGGGLLGAALANHFFVPIIGLQGVLVGLVALLVLVAVTGPLLGKHTGSGRRISLAVGALALVGMASFLPDLVGLYALKVAQATGAQSAQVVLIREGKAATVTVIDQSDPRKGTYRDMYLNGVEEASTRYWHVQLFKLLGILPPLIHESNEPKDAMVIAFGAGITAGSVLASDEVGSLDVVDLNPDIEGINNLFTEVNGDVFHKDRFNFHNDDGRNYLVTSGKQYDLIIGDSTHPRAYDSWILYTREFYEAAARRLKPGGIFAQWVPVTGSMRGELMRIHLNTFRSVFPNTTFWYIYGSDQAFLMATPEPFELDAKKLQPKLDQLPTWFRSEEYELDTVAHVGGFFWMDGQALDRMIAGESRINTDGVHFFDKQSAVWPLPAQWQLPAFQTSVLPYIRNGNESLVAALKTEQQAAGSLARYGFFNTPKDLEDAFCLLPDNGNVRYYMSLVTGGKIPDSENFCLERDVARFRKMMDSHPDNPLAINALASTLGEGGRLDEALPLAEKAVQLDPNNGMIQDTLGWIHYMRGDFKSADEALVKSDGLLPNHAIVLYHLGVVKHALGEESQAMELLKRSLEIDPGHFQQEHIHNLLMEMEL